MRKTLFALTVLLLLFSCTSSVKLFEMSPKSFENDDLTFDYRIGTRVYYLDIYNKTDSEVVIDADRIVIVSVEGETRSLNVLGSTNILPPKSSVVYQSFQDTVFDTDIDKIFISGYSPSGSTEVYTGSIIRLYVPYKINGKYKVADIELTIKGALNTRTSNPGRDIDYSILKH